MKGFFARALVMVVVCIGIGTTLNVRLNGAIDPDNNPTVMPADHALVEALAKADKAAVGKLLYTDFLDELGWRNSQQREGSGGLAEAALGG